MIELSKLYAHPVYKNDEKCFYWHQNAAGAGHVRSQAIIGKFYLEGKVSAEFDFQSSHKNPGHRPKYHKSNELFQTIGLQRERFRTCDARRALLQEKNVY